MKPLLTSLLLTALQTAQPSPTNQPLDLRHPPTIDQLAHLFAQGTQPALQNLTAALAASYRPAIGSMPGSVATPAYSAWLSTWKWLQILAKTEEDCARHLISLHLLHYENQPTLFLPGQEIPHTAKPLDPTQLDSFWHHPNTRDQILSSLLPPNLIPPHPQTLAEKFPTRRLLAWISNPKLSDALLRTLSDADYLPGVLHHLAAIEDAHPADFHTHTSLAIALAIVYDQALPSFWPHHQVSPSDVPIAQIYTPQTFHSWTAAQKSGHLWNDLTRLPPSDLKFIIDAPVAQTELDWARQNFRIPRTDFGRAFSSVKYRHDRLASHQLLWNNGPYTLQNILENGGICVDQAYFAMLAGKARGLPTLFFRGQGKDGGHAWFGYMKTSNRWDLECGRYENQNFVVGHALDPQTWRPISDHQLLTLTAGLRESRPFQASEDDRTLAAAFHQQGLPEIATKAYESSVATSPTNPNAWRDYTAFLALSNAPIPAQITLHERAAKALANHRDLRASHLSHIADLKRQLGQHTQADQISRQIISQNKYQRSDLSIAEGSQRILTLANSGQTAEALRIYRRLLASVGPDGGGNFFFQVLQPLVHTLLSQGLTREANQALQTARQSLRPSRNSLLDRSFSSLEKEILNPSTPPPQNHQK